jgi:protein TonB
MSRVLNILVFGSLATGLHLAAFAAQPPSDGAEASGAGGDALASLKAAPAAYGEMVEAWENQVSPVDPIEMPDMQSPALDEPVTQPNVTMPLPMPSPMPVPMTAPQMALPDLAAPVSPDMPQLDLAMRQPPKPTPQPTPAPQVVPDAPQVEPTPNTVKRPPVEARPVPPEVKQAKAPKPPKKIVKKTPPNKVQKPKKKAQAAQSAPSKATRAAGTGGGAQSGQSKSARAATLSKSQRQSLTARWGAEVRRKVDRNKRATGSGQRGRVVMLVTVSRTGALLGVKVSQSSGKASLDKAALSAVRRARQFSAAPKGLTKGQYTFRVKLDFTR